MKELVIKKCTASLLVWILLLGILPFSQTYAKAPSFYASDSKLSAGKWVKLRVQENAIYKLTFEDIKAMGIDPAKAKIYGYGGWILNESFNANDYADDLPVVPVWLSGSDNKLDPGEFVLFYGKGHVKWTYNATLSEYQHENNPYSNYGYYFITEGTDGMQLIPDAPAETVTAPANLTTFDDYAVHEQDLVAVIPSGRELFGENFASKRTQPFTFNIKNMAAGDALVKYGFISTADITGTSVSLSVNGNTPVTGYFSAATLSAPVQKFDNERATKWTSTESEEINAVVTFSHTGYNAYLNYIRLNMKRYLKPDGSFTFFRDKTNLTKDCSYEVANAASNMFVIELTPNKNIQKIASTYTDGKIAFNATRNTSTVREFALINPAGSFQKPEVVGTVDNQNLHKTPQNDMVIITQPMYWDQALRLAQYHIDHDGLKVEVVNANKIYNEFSSGNPDATAFRRFMKMFYDRAGSDITQRPKYLLLIGDGSHDNRRQTDKWRQISSDGYLLTYQSKNSTANGSESYVSDDYYGYLDDQTETLIYSGTLCLGIGRFPVKSVDEAKNAVDKVIKYMDNKTPGSWKNNLIFIGGDDDAAGSKDLHISQADNIAKQVEIDHPEYIISKVYYPAFKELKPQGYPTFPDAKDKVNKKLKSGALIMDYVGHGASTKIARDVITIADVNLMNFTNLPLWITATCDFGRYDDIANCAAEAAFLNKTSGGIAVITAARTVGSYANDSFNTQLLRYYMFTKDNGVWPRLGDIVRKSKNASKSENNLSYALLGDPALILAYPESTVQVDTVNGQLIGTEPLQLKSRESVVIQGVIRGTDGEVDTDFNGTIQATVMDYPQELSSLTLLDGKYFRFSEYLNVISIAKGNVTNGVYTMSFPVPKDISHSEKTGKISFYAVNQSDSREANGSFCKFYLKGIADDGVQSTAGPQIHAMYLNYDSFRSGDAVNEKPYFVAHVSDTLGINRAGLGIGHDIILSIDNKPLNTYALNTYFEDDSNKPGYGTIRFSIPDSLSVGNHTLTFKVWNVMNLSAEQTLDFRVEAGKAPIIFDLTANPNPAKTDVYFNFKHDRPETFVKIKIAVFDLTGSPIWENEASGITNELAQTPVHWDLVSSTGQRVKPGIYVYRASISGKFGKEATASRKLIILAQ